MIYHEAKEIRKKCLEARFVKENLIGVFGEQYLPKLECASNIKRLHVLGKF